MTVNTFATYTQFWLTFLQAYETTIPSYECL